MKPSAEDVLALLRRHPAGITPLTALEEAGCFRLGARIWDLKQAGYVIRTEMVRTSSGKSVAKYTLEAPADLTLFGAA